MYLQRNTFAASNVCSDRDFFLLWFCQQKYNSSILVQLPHSSFCEKKLLEKKVAK